MNSWQNINTQSLRQMNLAEQETLCRDIRRMLIETVTKNGGHLASNLGVVELTVALHRTFESHKDRIIWDVGHQCYVHKILTGRAQRFATLRQAGGLSGFPRRAESQHDAFDTGHSSTSLSAALGMAIARSRQKQDEHIVAVIGDGAMTGGMCYEALNQIGASREKMVIVLNDNDMSISPSVGAMHYHLSKFRSNPRYMGVKRHMQRHMSRFSRVLEKIKNSIKYLFVSSAFFEEMGIKYLGPIDGHDLLALEKILSQAKQFDVPVLVHVLTQKGKGYAAAEKNPTDFHGLSPAQPKNPDDPPAPKPRGNSAVCAQKLAALAAKDARIVAITAAMPTGTGLDGFAKAYPERFFDVGIAEQHAVTLAAGMAVGGLRPVFMVYSTFLQRAYDQILHDVCLPKLPVVFAVDRAGIVGEDGSTHQGVFDIAYLGQMPGLTVFSPADQCELEQMLAMALTLDTPAAIRYPRQALPPGEASTPPIEWGRWHSPRQPQGALALIASGGMVPNARQVAALLAMKEGQVNVINARFLKPLDEALLRELAGRHSHIATLEDGVLRGGLGENVARFLLEECDYQGHYRHFSMPERPLPHGTAAQQMQWAGLDAPSMASTLRTWMENTHAGKMQTGRIIG